MNTTTKNSDTIILHDTFLYRGGGERLVKFMRDTLDADLASGFFSDGSYPMDEIVDDEKVRIIPLMSSAVFTKGMRHILLKLNFMFGTKFLREYDTVIFSGDCLSAIRNVRSDAKKIYYCHTPPRYIFDKAEWYEQQLPKYYPVIWRLMLPLYRWLRGVFARMYIREIQKFDIIVANAREIQKRLKTYCDVDSVILNPPVDVERFRSVDGEKGDYFLFFGRLAEMKRVDRIIEAFQDMPDKKVIITYGKHDPARRELMSMAQGYDNIEFVTDVSDDQAITLLSEALATLYIPRDEDFGMVPIESMACGTPVIGVKEGGLLETVINGETGILIDGHAPVEQLRAAVKELNTHTSKSMSEACRRQSEKFSLESFQKQLQSIVQS